MLNGCSNLYFLHCYARPPQNGDRSLEGGARDIAHISQRAQLKSSKQSPSPQRLDTLRQSTQPAQVDTDPAKASGEGYCTASKLKVSNLLSIQLPTNAPSFGQELWACVWQDLNKPLRTWFITRSWRHGKYQGSQHTQTTWRRMMLHDHNRIAHQNHSRRRHHNCKTK